MKKNKGFLYLVLAILCVWTPLFMGAWDKDKPSASTSLRSSNPEILANWSALEDAINREHSFSTGGTATAQGEHTQGSAKAFSQATAPTTQVDGGAFASTDLGSIWVDTDDNAVYFLTATTPTWTPVSTEIIATLLAANRIFGGTLGVTGNFAVNTNKFTVAAATGNTVMAGTASVGGTLDVTGAAEVTGVATLGDASLLKTTAAPTTDAMIANKKYVDDQDAANFSPNPAVGNDESNGIITFDSGFQMIWGKAVQAGTITFHTAFTTKCFHVQLTYEHTATTNVIHPPVVETGTISKTGFTYHFDGTPSHIYYFAIGR